MKSNYESVSKGRLSAGRLFWAGLLGLSMSVAVVGCSKAAPPAESQAPIPPSAGSSPSTDKLPKRIAPGSKNSSPAAR